MLQTENDEIVLGIESAVRGGSISICRGELVIDSRIGKGGISKAEDLLADIDEILKNNSIDKAEINTIAVSTGPGSYTGIRVGIATALGLSGALKIKVAGVNVLKAIAAKSSSRKVIAAVPLGGDQICWQQFVRQTVSLPLQADSLSYSVQIGQVKDFLAYLTENPDTKAVVHTDIYNSFSNMNLANICDAGSDLARHIALAVRNKAASDNVKPNYIFSKF